MEATLIIGNVNEKPLGEILSRLFAARGWGRKQERLKLEQAWADAAGAEIAARRRGDATPDYPACL